VQKTEFVIKFTADIDPVPGWGDDPQDWINLATKDFLNQDHYHTTAEVLDVKVLDRAKEPTQ